MGSEERPQRSVPPPALLRGYAVGRGGDYMAVALLLELGHRCGNQIEDALHVHVDFGHPFVDLQLAHVSGGHDARVGEDRVNFSEAFFCKCHERLHVVQAGCVARQVGDVVGAQLFRYFPQSAFAACGKRHFRAGRYELPGRLAPDSLRCAGGGRA